MKQVKLLMDVQLNDEGDYLSEGSIFSLSNTWRRYEGFTAIIVDGVTEHFKSECFEEVE